MAMQGGMRRIAGASVVAAALVGVAGCSTTPGVARKERLPRESMGSERFLETPADVDTVLILPSSTSPPAAADDGVGRGRSWVDSNVQPASGAEAAPRRADAAQEASISEFAWDADPKPAGEGSRAGRMRELATRVQRAQPDRLAAFWEDVRKGAAQGTLRDVLETWEVAVEFEAPPPSALGESLSASFVRTRGEAGPQPPTAGEPPAVRHAASKPYRLSEDPGESAAEGGAPAADEPPELPRRVAALENAPRRLIYRDLATPEGSPGDAAKEAPTSAPEFGEEKLADWASELERWAERDSKGRVRWQVASRLLRAASGDSAGAVEPIASSEGAERRFWRHLAHAATKYLDEGAYPRAGLRATEAAISLRESIRALSEKADLEITEPIFCRSVQSFGNYDEFPKDEFRAGEGVVVYWEAKNFTSVESAEGYRTRMQAEFEILDSLGTRRRQFVQKFKDDVCRTPRTDYFNVVVFEWPRDLTPGEYTLKVTVTDLTSEKTCERQKKLRIGP